jgi:thymidine phosphorylase
MLVLGGLAANTENATQQLQAVLDSGAAAERFASMVAALGGPGDLLERPDAYLGRAPVVVPVPATRSGVLAAMDTRAIGLAVVELGGGRRLATDRIDLHVGLSAVRPLGATVAEGDAMALVHAANADAARHAVARLQAAIAIGDDGAPSTPCVLAMVNAQPGCDATTHRKEP